MYKGNYVINDGESLGEDITSSKRSEVLRRLKNIAESKLDCGADGTITIYEDEEVESIYESKWTDDGFVWKKKTL